jgi:hypothetical protein
MYRWKPLLLVAILSLCFSATTAFAADAAVAEGKIKSVDAGAMTFVLTVEDNDITVKVTESTKYMLDGKASTMEAALKPGFQAKVTHANSVASVVDAWSSQNR